MTLANSCIILQELRANNRLITERARWQWESDASQDSTELSDREQHVRIQRRRHLIELLIEQNSAGASRWVDRLLVEIEAIEEGLL